MASSIVPTLGVVKGTSELKALGRFACEACGRWQASHLVINRPDYPPPPNWC